MSENIKGIKLLNGAELIADIISENEKELELKNAVAWDLVQLQDKKFDLQFFPLTNGAKLPPNATHYAVDIKLPRVAIFFEYVLRDEIEQKYRQFISPIMLLK
jgi:hypothetical protein